MKKRISEKYRVLIAKTDPADTRRWLPLWMHLRDTAEVMKKLVHEWLPEATITATGMDFLEVKEAAVFLAAIHDIGKATSAFQYMITKKLEGRRENLEYQGLRIPEYLRDPYGTPHAYAGKWILESRVLPFQLPHNYADIVGAHHGKPFSSKPGPGSDDLVEVLPVNFYGVEKEAAVIDRWQETWKEILEDAFVLSGIESPSRLPVLTGTAQVLLSGLLIAADWIASNSLYFPLLDTEDEGNGKLYSERIEKGWMKANMPEGWHPEIQQMTKEMFAGKFGFLPNSVQAAVLEIVNTSKKPGLLILEAQMGCGKTEAALAASEVIAGRNGQAGIFFGLPTQATSNGIFERLYEWAKKDSDEFRKAIRLAHNAAELNEIYQRIPKGGNVFTDDVDSEDGGVGVYPWFQGNKKALLADFVAGTVDQFLMAALRRRFFMLRHIGLAGKVVIIDECHAYDAYMSEYLARALMWMGAYKVPVILLSATLNTEKRIDLLCAYMRGYLDCPRKEKKDKLKNYRESMRKMQGYPLLTWTDGGELHQKGFDLETDEKQIEIKKIYGMDSLPEFLLDQLKDGGCAAIILNTVKMAQQVYGQVKNSVPDATILLYHAQFTAPDRQNIEARLMKHMGKCSEKKERFRFILIGTQVLEQSLDYDADLLITQLCPVDLLLQRIGRLHRHERTSRPGKLSVPRCCLLLEKDRLYDEATEYIYDPYVLLKSAQTIPDKVLLPGDIPELVERVYHMETDEQNLPEDLKEVFKMHQKKEEDKKERGKNYLLQEPLKERETLKNMLQNENSIDEEAAEASVRGGNLSLEVLIMQKQLTGRITFFGETEQEGFAADLCPEESEAREIAMQRLKLPYRFCLPNKIFSTICELEEQNRKELPNWQKSPWLKGKLVLLFDEKKEARLGNYIIKYSKEYGLQFEEADDTFNAEDAQL